VERIVRYIDDDPTDPTQTPWMKCSGLDPLENSIPKIVGMAFSYSEDFTGGSNLPQDLFVEHDPLMHWKLPNGDRLYRTLDYWTFDPDAGIRVAPVMRPVALLKDGEISEQCEGSLSSKKYTTAACMQELLGEGNLAPRLFRGQAGSGANDPYRFNVNFFNSYLGGKWFLYAPIDEGTYNAWLASISKLKVHLYYSYEVTKN
jgi:hypothetical protein